MRRSFALTIVAIILGRWRLAAMEFSCKDTNLANVDWFYAYKFPEINDSETKELLGNEFMYVDVNNSKEWRRSPHPIDSERSAIGATTAQIFLAMKRQRSGNIFYALYNDHFPISPEFPKGQSGPSSRGHMKGFLIFDMEEKRGFWMIHSLPRFPQTKFKASETPKYIYSPNGGDYGQTFLCINVATTQLSAIGKLLLMATPAFYDHHIPPSLQRIYPEIHQAIVTDVMRYKNGDPTHIYLEVKSLGGQVFTSFSKNAKYNNELYMDFVAKKLKVSLSVRTWLTGSGSLPSARDNGIEVSNIIFITLDNHAIKSSKDHSKWAVSKTRESPWICVGDINRQVAQLTRGGQTMCLQNKNIWRRFRSIVLTEETVIDPRMHLSTQLSRLSISVDDDDNKVRESENLSKERKDRGRTPTPRDRIQPLPRKQSKRGDSTRLSSSTQSSTGTRNQQNSSRTRDVSRPSGGRHGSQLSGERRRTSGETFNRHSSVRRESRTRRSSSKMKTPIPDNRDDDLDVPDIGKLKLNDSEETTPAAEKRRGRSRLRSGAADAPSSSKARAASPELPDIGKLTLADKPQDKRRQSNATATPKATPKPRRVVSPPLGKLRARTPTGLAIRPAQTPRASVRGASAPAAVTRKVTKNPTPVMNAISKLTQPAKGDAKVSAQRTPPRTPPNKLSAKTTPKSAPTKPAAKATKETPAKAVKVTPPKAKSRPVTSLQAAVGKKSTLAKAVETKVEAKATPTKATQQTPARVTRATPPKVTSPKTTPTKAAADKKPASAKATGGKMSDSDIDLGTTTQKKTPITRRTSVRVTRANSPSIKAANSRRTTSTKVSDDEANGTDTERQLRRSPRGAAQAANKTNSIRASSVSKSSSVSKIQRSLDKRGSSRRGAALAAAIA